MGAPDCHLGTRENHLRRESLGETIVPSQNVITRPRAGTCQRRRRTVLPGGTYKVLKALCTWLQEGKVGGAMMNPPIKQVQG